MRERNESPVSFTYTGLGVEPPARTTLNCPNSETAAFWKDIGAKRIILERVLSLKEVIAIRERAGIDVELFVYGNFCYFYYGGCRLSSYYYGEMCFAPCLDRYTIEDLPQAGPTPFSGKYLNAYDALPEIYDAGVSAVKIEGREKSRGYILTVLRVLRRAVDALKKGEKIPPPPEKSRYFLMPPVTTPGFYEGFPDARDTINDESGWKSGFRKFAIYCTPAGIRYALYRTRKRRKAFRDANRLSDS